MITKKRIALAVAVVSFGYAIYLFCETLTQSRDAAANATLLAAAVAAGAGALVIHQIDLLQKQTQLDAIIRLDQEWRSDQMIKQRKSAWKDNDHPDEEKIEDVLEFLEPASSFVAQEIIDPNLVWDTFGWYMIRYYSCCQNEIEILRDKWTNSHDKTLYQDLEALYKRLVDKEAKARRIAPAEVEGELDSKRRLFIQTERNLQANEQTTN